MTTIILSVCSGLVGVLATLWWNQIMGKRAEKVRLFKTLMACRGHIVSEENVKALNLVDVELLWKASLQNQMAIVSQRANNQPN